MKQQSKSTLPPPTLIDRAVSYFNPEAGLRRMKARMQTGVMASVGSYLGARLDRRATQLWTPYPGAADDDTLPDLPTLRSRSRDLVRNAPIATGAVLTLGMNVVGTGLSLLARPDWEFLGMTEAEAEDWKDNVERLFRTWGESENCDITRTQNFYGIQGLVFRSSMESGDCFVLLLMVDRPKVLFSLALQVIEADRVANPQGISPFERKPGGPIIADGVELDKNGAPVAYHIFNYHPGSFASLADRKSTRVPAFGAKTQRRNVAHTFERTRPGQSRGIPLLAPVIEPLKQLDRYSEAELMAAVVGGMLAVFVKTDAGEGFANNPSFSSSDQDRQVPLESGTITDLRPGEDIGTVAPNRPNQAFEPFVKAIYEQIAVALGLPFEVMIKHFTASYSAARAAMLEAWKLYKSQRNFLSTKLCAPVYEAFLEECIARGLVEAPGFFDDPMVRAAYLQAEWIGDAQGQIDPNKEVEAAKTRLEIGVSSLQRETMGLTGAEWTDVHREQVKEKQMRDEGGLTVVNGPGGPAADPQEEDAAMVET